MSTPKRKAEDVVAGMRRDFRRDQEIEEAIFEDTLNGFTIPLIEAGLVDDVEPQGVTVGMSTDNTRFTPPKTAVIKLSELRPDLSLLPRHYIESDLDRVARELRAKHPGKTVRVCDNHNGTYKVSLTEHFTVNIRGERA